MAGKGSIDELEYLNGLKYRRDFIEWDENGYVLEIGRITRSLKFSGLWMELKKILA